MKYDAFFSKARLTEQGLIINAPEEIESEFRQSGYQKKPETNGEACLLFIRNSHELSEFLPSLKT